MAVTKRSLEESSTNRRSKKAKTSEGNSQKPAQATSSLVTEDVDFPRGGGTTFTPLEVKKLRTEAIEEANAELFQNSHAAKNEEKKRKRKSEGASTSSVKKTEKKDSFRIEHLNYKRLVPGMKILGQIVTILPLSLIVSLPSRLVAHVPITNISSQLTASLERMEEDADESTISDEEENLAHSQAPDLSEIFSVGQFVRAIVSAVHAPGSTDMSGIGKSREDLARASRRVELSLIPGQVNAGVQKADLETGFSLTGAVKSVEDHGYILDLGISDTSAFLAFEDAKQYVKPKPHVGQLIDVTVKKMSANGRTCTLDADPEMFRTTSLSEVSSVSSVLPGALVQALVTDVDLDGLNLQILAFFDGSVDRSHLPRLSTCTLKVGKKVKARVLYEYSSSPPRFALSLCEHVVGLHTYQVNKSELPGKQTMAEACPVGTILDAVKVTFVESERGIMVASSSGLQGFVHISKLSDEYVSILSYSSGPWKIGSVHRARVIGYFAFDGILELSLKTSVLEQKYLQVKDLEVGEIVKGTIKKLTDTGLFVSLSGNVNGVVWPNHYADIILKHPAKRFKVGGSIKCRVLVIDADRSRMSLTAKKTLLESDLDILSKFEQATVGMITHAVIFKVHEKYLLVEFYNNLKALIPAKEASEIPVSSLSLSFPVGKTVRVRITSVDTEHKQIIASIRQASTKSALNDISGVEIGDIVHGSVSEVHKNNVIVILEPGNIRAIMSLKNLANHLGLSVPELRVSLKSGDTLSDLIVVTRNLEKAFVIVANKPKIREGQKMDGVVKKIEDYGLFIQLGDSNLSGLCHKSQLSDNQDADVSVALRGFREGDRVRTVIVGIEKKRISLSLKPSHLEGEETCSIQLDDGRPSQSRGSGNDVHHMGDGDGEIQLVDVVSGDHDNQPMQVDLDEITRSTQQNNAKNICTSKIGAGQALPLLSLSQGFQWSGNFVSEQEAALASSDESDKEQGSSTKKKKNKRKEIEYDLTADMHTKKPESNADFERLLLGSPNSSYLWIQYMSFQLQMAEIDKAREIARRACKTISFREELERLNVWIALLNLENAYGTDESMDVTFKEAARANDSKTVHLRVATIYDQSDKPEKAEEMFQRTCKKFGRSSKVWTLFGEYHLKRGNLDEFRKLLPRSLQGLEKRKHVKTISRFAQLEYKLGGAERGKTLFEGILDSYTKRWDLWSIYIDMEAGQRNIQSIRNIFDRLLTYRMTSHKAKAFFKKWLALEKRIGDDEGVNVVKQKAVEWTQKAAGISS